VIPPPDGMEPQAWADALTHEVRSTIIPPFAPGQDWQAWGDTLVQVAGRSLDVPQPQDYDTFEAWATDLLRSNDRGPL
jgi:hypothetical protein